MTPPRGRIIGDVRGGLHDDDTVDADQPSAMSVAACVRERASPRDARPASRRVVMRRLPLRRPGLRVVGELVVQGGVGGGPVDERLRLRSRASRLMSSHGRRRSTLPPAHPSRRPYSAMLRAGPSRTMERIVVETLRHTESEDRASRDPDRSRTRAHEVDRPISRRRRPAGRRRRSGRAPHRPWTVSPETRVPGRARTVRAGHPG